MSSLILDHLIEKHSHTILHGVYRLSYAGKYIIVKGRSLSGSLFFIQKGYKGFREEMVKPDTLYVYFYRHIKENPGGRFRMKVFLKSGDHYALLKREQMELDKSRFDPDCLNNAVEAYLPKFDIVTERYGWLDTGAVLNFKRYLGSKKRKSLLSEYKRKLQPKPAMSV